MSAEGGEKQPVRGCLSLWSSSWVGRVVRLLLLVWVALVGISFILHPGTYRIRERAPITNCANTLRQVGVASIAYMNSNVGPGNRSGFMPHVRGVDELDGPEDVGKAFEMLVHVREIDDASLFVCYASEDIPILIGADERLSDFRFEAGTNVMDAPNFSYGWVKRQVTTSNARSFDAIAADRSLTLTPEELGWGRDRQLINHREGRNFLRYDGSIMFVSRDEELAATPDPDIRAMLDQLNIIAAKKD